MLGIPLQPWEGPDILLADGQRTRPSGKIEIKVIIDKIVVEVSAIVLQIYGCDLLLGNDTLRKLISIKINYTAEQASFHLGDIDCSDNKPAVHSSFIFAKEAQTIPAHSMMAIAVERTNLKNASTNVGLLMVEPSSKVMLDKGLSVGWFCYQSDSPPDVVQLISFSDSPQWIGKGSKLGEIINVEVTDTSPLPPEDQDIDFNFENSINTELLDEHRQAIKDLLYKRRYCFTTSDDDLGSSNLVQHEINIGNNQPVHQAPYPSAWKQREIIEPQVKKIRQADVIEHSQSPFAAPVVLVRKTDGSWRCCVDYRRLNAITIKDVYPLPRIDDALSRLEGSTYFSLMDLQSGYWQVQMKPEDREKTAFITADGLYQFKVMPFGLTNAPSTFQRMMDVLLAGLKWNSCHVYLDDIVFFSDSVLQHLTHTT
jgi:hypothetical protein